MGLRPALVVKSQAEACTNCGRGYVHRRADSRCTLAGSRMPSTPRLRSNPNSLGRHERRWCCCRTPSQLTCRSRRRPGSQRSSRPGTAGSASCSSTRNGCSSPRRIRLEVGVTCGPGMKRAAVVGGQRQRRSDCLASQTANSRSHDESERAAAQRGGCVMPWMHVLPPILWTPSLTRRRGAWGPGHLSSSPTEVQKYLSTSPPVEPVPLQV